LKIIHIAGSNGKGSTAEFFTQILIAAGKKVGTFTSPAVYDFYDQFRIDGKPMPDELAEKYFERALAASDGLNPTDFEIQTAGVLLAFKEEGCEYAVIECGMGGLNDATNAINKKELAVITSISLEHTAYLGNTIEEICANKAGIIKGGCPVIVNDYQPSEEAREYFKKLGCIFADCFELGIIYDGDKFEYGGMEYRLSVFKSCQKYNAATAIEGAQILGIPQKAISDGLKNAKPAGRVEKITEGGRDYILDGGHNVNALEPLRFWLECSYRSNSDGKEVTVIFGCLKDKDINGNLAMLKGLAGNIIAVECPNPRARSLRETAEACGKYFNNVRTAESVSDALEKADTKTVVVCGSFTLLKEAKLWIEKRL
ncbi:MAG: hypothetical protein K2O67_06270, partial [Clostridia bacterium]|nr:hypothetical protein [Clostridia bacterium]